jgi:uncharacterized protein (DUF1697 family)
MEALRAFYESLGFRDPQTYVQRGNVVFQTKQRDLVALARKVENGIEWSFGFRTTVIVRTAPELRDVSARNPFRSRRGIDPRKLPVTFLASNPAAEALELVLKINTEPEEVHIDGREVYIYFPNGMARPRFRGSRSRRS